MADHDQGPGPATAISDEGHESFWAGRRSPTTEDEQREYLMLYFTTSETRWQGNPFPSPWTYVRHRLRATAAYHDNPSRLEQDTYDLAMDALRKVLERLDAHGAVQDQLGPFGIRRYLFRVLRQVAQAHVGMVTQEDQQLRLDAATGDVAAPFQDPEEPSVREVADKHVRVERADGSTEVLDLREALIEAFQWRVERGAIVGTTGRRISPDPTRTVNTARVLQVAIRVRDELIEAMETAEASMDVIARLRFWNGRDARTFPFVTVERQREIIEEVLASVVSSVDPKTKERLWRPAATLIRDAVVIVCARLAGEPFDPASD